MLCDICFWCFPVVSVSECEHFDIFCICTWLRGIVAYTWTKNKVSYKVIVKFTENCVFIVERELTGKQVRKMKGLEGWINLVCAFEVLNKSCVCFWSEDQLCVYRKILT